MQPNELISFINSVESGTSKPIRGFDAYAVNTSGYRGVAIVIEDDIEIREKFNNVEVKNLTIKIKDEEKKIIFLYTFGQFMLENYGMLCLDFLKESNRQKIKTTPITWFNEWKELIGNAIKNKIIYDIIGEMKVLLHFQNNNENPVWNSIISGTYDITTTNNVYEVKTTISKSKDSVTIHNQFQLDDDGLNDCLNIAFVRVEKNDTGDSIETLYNKLVESGYNKDSLDDYLSTCGYYPGKAERYIKYITQEIRIYPVDNKFPKITKESFVNSKFPIGIVNFQYEVSLDNLEYSRIL